MTTAFLSTGYVTDRTMNYQCYLHVSIYEDMAKQDKSSMTCLVLPYPSDPFGHHPGRHQARHAHILQIGLRLAIAQADARPVMPVVTSLQQITKRMISPRT